jgi:hypothetical protein
MENYQNPQVPQQAPVAPAEAQLPQANKKGFDVKKLIPVVAVVVVVAIVIALFGGGHTGPVDDYFEIIYNGKISNIKKMAPKETWDGDEEELQEIIDGYQEYYDESVEENGKAKLDYEITDSKKLDKDDDEFEMIAESAEEYFDVDEDDVKKVYEIDVEGTVEYEDSEDEIDTTYYSAKIGGKWYLFTESGVPVFYGIAMLGALYSMD